jgi:hypothetical protein
MARGEAESTENGLPKMLMAAGHGLYFNHKYGDWRPQRDVSNGILEDDITQEFVSVAKAHIEKERRGSPRSVVSARALLADIHSESGQPWLRISARYWIKKQFPELEILWSKRGNASAGDKERIQDIYSRPILANHLGVNAAVHLHTNASNDHAKSGLQVYYQKGSSNSEAFGQKISCQLWRSIGDRFRKYRVPLTPLPGDYAELRGSNMPAAIVELGFHTNPNDALILQDEDFKNAVANALDKSFLNQIDGTGCGSFTVNDFKYEVSAEGDPDWPGAEISFSYAAPSGEILPDQLYVQIVQDGECKRRLYQARVDNLWFKNVRPTPGIAKAGVSCDSPFVDEPVEVRLLSYDQLLWSKKMKLTCPSIYPVEFCGCNFCPQAPDE